MPELFLDPFVDQRGLVEPAAYRGIVDCLVFGLSQRDAHDMRALKDRRGHYLSSSSKSVTSCCCPNAASFWMESVVGILAISASSTRRTAAAP